MDIDYYSVWQEYRGLIVGVGGAIITLLLTMTGEFVRRKKTLSLLVIFMLGFVLFTIREIIGLSEHNIIEEIQTKVSLTYDIVSNLEDTPFDQYSLRLSTLRNDSNAEGLNRIEVMDKPSIDQWEKYAAWLRRMRSKNDATPCLSITVNAHHSYKSSLIQAALLTDKDTESVIGDVITSTQWRNFPDDHFIHEFGLTPRSVECVLFFDNNPKRLIGYSDARSFSVELYVKRKQFEDRNIESRLNGRLDNPKDELGNMFSTLNTTVRNSKDVNEIVNAMIEQEVTEVVVIENGDKYLVKLLDLVDLAQESR